MRIPQHNVLMEVNAIPNVVVTMPIKCRKCGFENPSEMEYCGSCGTLFDGTEQRPSLVRRRVVSSSDYDDRGRISLLLYLGTGMIALSGLLSAYVVASLHGGRSPSSFGDYSGAILIVGVAFVLVGFARQAKRMRE